MTISTPITCVITRPAHQAKHLYELLIQKDIRCILLPTLEITPHPNLQQNIIQALKQADKIIFTSANAIPAVIPHLPLLKGTTLFAIGEATRKALAEHHMDAIIPKDSHFNSEGLLALPMLQSLKHQHIVIFSGEGGRSLLLETLKKRHAQVQKVPVYQRTKPKTDISKLEKEEIDWIISTSGESLRNLWEMAGEKHQHWLSKQHLLVISPTMKKLAHDLGFLRPALVSPNASDAAVCQTLLGKLAKTSSRNA